MSHVRQQIRSSVIELLNAVPELAGRVSVARAGSLGRDELPAVIVSTPTESVEYEMSRQSRLLTVQVECISAGPETTDALDAIAVAVETALDQPALDDLVVEWRLTSIEIHFAGDEQVTPIGAALLTYTALYHVTLTNPEISV